MIYDARQIVNWFIQRAAQDGRSLSIMSLLKMAYIAHGWRLEMQNEPLFHNEIEAWQYGPVIPDVYHEFRSQGIRPSKIASNYPTPLNPNDVTFLGQIYDIYGIMSAFKLSDLTHVEGGPWEVSRSWGGNYAEIPNDLIKSHYISKRQVVNQADG